MMIRVFLKIHSAALPVGEAAVVQHLQAAR